MKRSINRDISQITGGENMKTLKDLLGKLLAIVTIGLLFAQNLLAAIITFAIGFIILLLIPSRKQLR